jgi:hypothetical protein
MSAPKGVFCPERSPEGPKTASPLDPGIPTEKGFGPTQREAGCRADLRSRGSIFFSRRAPPMGPARARLRGVASSKGHARTRIHAHRDAGRRRHPRPARHAGRKTRLDRGRKGQRAHRARQVSRISRSRVHVAHVSGRRVAELARRVGSAAGPGGHAELRPPGSGPVGPALPPRSERRGTRLFERPRSRAGHRRRHLLRAARRRSAAIGAGPPRPRRGPGRALRA